MKNIIVAGAALCMGMTACTGSFLDEKTDPNNLTPSVFWKSEGDIVKGLTSAYACLQPSMSWGAPFERFIVVDNYRSDELDFRADVTSWLQLASFVNTPTDDVTSSEWTYLYRGINYANQCIDNIPTVPAVSEEIKSRSIAEARFLRAYYYFRLYLNFGERIPLYTKQLVGTNEEFYPTQAAAGELVAFMEKELTEIQSLLPEPGAYKAEEIGRVTRYAAAAILGKLHMACREEAKAEKEFAKLIGKYELMPEFKDNFDGMHKNNRESVFEVQFSGDRSGGHREYNRIALHLASSNAEGYEEAYPSYWLFETMKKDKTSDGKYSDRLYNTILFDDKETEAFYFEEGKHFIDYHGKDEIFWHKFVTWDSSLSQYWDCSAYNIPIVRYADVLLLYAECLNDRGATAEAIGYINQVRARVDVPALPTTMSKDAVLKHLQDVERPCELALEGSRWYDLIRWGIVGKALVDHKKPYVENFVESKHQLLPIPHSEFLLNPSWEQNPNFSK
ncbi:MAG: RagB/SusD family nutrient uptake outer membrane protein [Tannerellaceae bacterium]